MTRKTRQEPTSPLPELAQGRLLTVEEAAERLNTSVRFPRRLIEERRIAFIHVGRNVRICPFPRVETEPGEVWWQQSQTALIRRSRDVGLAWDAAEGKSRLPPQPSTAFVVQLRSSRSRVPPPEASSDWTGEIGRVSC
ncbi:excisionase family DNA-binding protein [Streptosporangium sp. LJ11]|uniref:excisionase family DNA-binding protein n=1 Tax=Streptosporangium sp. LJ11 TaxID=3436927 RepID=UPI003F7AB0E1